MKFTKGTVTQFMEAVERRISELEGADVESATNTSGIANKVTLIDVEECNHLRRTIKRASVDECDKVVSASETYSDPNGVLGDPDGKYTSEDLRKIYDESKGSDPVIDQYNSYDEWLADTKQFLHPVTAASEDENRDGYIKRLMGDLDEELSEEVDSMEWSTDDANVIVTVSVGDDIHEYTVPFADLQFDWDDIPTDVDYILDEIGADIAEIN